MMESGDKVLREATTGWSERELAIAEALRSAFTEDQTVINGHDSSSISPPLAAELAARRSGLNRAQRRKLMRERVK